MGLEKFTTYEAYKQWFDDSGSCKEPLSEKQFYRSIRYNRYQKDEAPPFIMENFYKILEISPTASAEEIKAAYRSLCQEYHPDKLPPGTPDKARRYVEERFKQINEAYSVLSDPDSRRRYDLNFSSSSSYPRQESSSTTPSSFAFDPEKLRQVSERLELLKKKIETECSELEEEIDQSVKRQLHELGYKEEELQGETISGKVGSIILAIWLASAGFWLMGLGNSFLWWIGLIWLGFWVLGALWFASVPTLSENAAKKIKPIKEKADAEKFKARQKRQERLDKLKRHQRQRIDFFKALPIQMITEEYIASLTDEDQLFLLQAIQERQDAEQLTQNLKTVARVAVGLGVLAALFGLGIPGG